MLFTGAKFISYSCLILIFSLTISCTLIELVSFAKDEVRLGKVPGRWLGPTNIVFDENDVRALAKEHVLSCALERR